MTNSFKLRLTVLVCAGLLLPLAGHAGSSKPTRAEKMLMNLRMGHGSTSFYIFEAVHKSKAMDKDLRRALFQLREVDRAYAKSRGRPDDRYLEAVALKLERMRETNKQLHKELRDYNIDLRETIKQTLLSGALQK